MRQKRVFLKVAGYKRVEIWRRRVGDGEGQTRQNMHENAIRNFVTCMLFQNAWKHLQITLIKGRQESLPCYISTQVQSYCE